MRRLRANRFSVFTYLRLLAGSVGAALASLAIVEAQSWPMVVLTLGVTEWGHVVALLGLATLLPGWRRTRAARTGGMLGLITVALSLSSLMRAAWLARRLPAQLTGSFGQAVPRSAAGAPPRAAPLVAREVLLGIRSPKVPKSRIRYATSGGQELDLDLYRAASASGSAPCVVVIHGGSWNSGDSLQIPGLNSYLAARGYQVAAINYRLAPQHRFPAARDDVLAAIAYLKANAAELGIDRQRFVLVGRSAGAQLALLVAYSANDSAIRGAIGFYGPADLVYGHRHPAKMAIIDSVGVIEAYLGGGPDSAPEIYAAASPASQAQIGCPPTLLIHGERDNLVTPVQSERLAARLAAVGCPHLLLRLPWATHGCDVNFSGPSGQISTFAIERFLAAVMR